VDAVLERERLMPTYLGRGLAVPHARVEGLPKPLLIFAQAADGVPVPGRSDPARLCFIVLTPASSPRDQARLLARIGGILDSELVEGQLREGRTPDVVLEAIRSGELALLG
jgi:mannitol/fructose-specific phosphotransferase system IIA component (Ntr-type)